MSMGLRELFSATMWTWSPGVTLGTDASTSGSYLACSPNA